MRSFVALSPRIRPIQIRSLQHALEDGRLPCSLASRQDRWRRGFRPVQPHHSFASDPPNATVSAFNSKDGSVKDAVVVLKNPKLDGDKLVFTVQTLEGDLTGADGAASIFIDIIGRPFTPLSFAGVARRTAFRGAMYAGAAAVGAAYARPYCGYYPYPPCY